VDRPGALGPPWTDAGADNGHGGALTGARRRGCKTEREARGARLGPHRDLSGVEEDGDDGEGSVVSALGEREARAPREGK
jgi:hypothetical protein